MDTKENRDKILQLFNPKNEFELNLTLIFIRGNLIGLFSKMEFDLSLFLSYSLNENPYKRRTFKEETKLLKQFLADNHTVFVNANPNFIERVRHFHRLRVKMAHWHIVVPKSDDYSKVNYFDIVTTDDIRNNSISPEKYYISTFKEDIKEIKDIVTKLLELIQIVK